MKAIIEMASTGDLTANMILDRLFPIPHPQTYIDSSYIKGVVTYQDASQAITLIMNDLADQELSLEEAKALMELLKCKVELTQLCI